MFTKKRSRNALPIDILKPSLREEIFNLSLVDLFLMIGLKMQNHNQREYRLVFNSYLIKLTSELRYTYILNKEAF